MDAVRRERERELNAAAYSKECRLIFRHDASYSLPLALGHTRFLNAVCDFARRPRHSRPVSGLVIEPGFSRTLCGSKRLWVT